MSRPRKNCRPTAVNGRFVTRAQAQALKQLARAQATGRTARARQLGLQLEAALAAAGDADWLKAALAETAALEQARDVVLERTGGPVRLRGRDGLETLRQAGVLSAAQAAAGLAYRRRFEAAQARQPSSLDIRPGGGGPRGLPEAVALRLAQARLDVDRLEQAVAARYAGVRRAALAADAVMVLREVAGLGRAVRTLATSGARRAALTGRLTEALAILARLTGGAMAQDG